MGSSPLARGLLTPEHVTLTLAGIIPARAGFTGHGCRRERGARDHPRSRGVYGTWVGWVLDAAGIIPARAGFTHGLGLIDGPKKDHPRSRGVYHRFYRGLCSGCWIIPARAGFTMTWHDCAWITRDHPRSRGVYTMGTTPPRWTTGSSPLARGLPRGSCHGRGDRGIIPARAGFTRAPAAYALRDEDHPRSRGVYSATTTPGQNTVGSSPLARGLPEDVGVGGVDVGIIPARAGFTDRRSGRPRARGDHPRSRGVYRRRRAGGCRGHGSSPLARGLRRPARPRAGGGGIIPARAGFTWICTAPTPTPVGSSPLARGLLVGAEDVGVGGGIIPARAGFTPGCR